MEAWDEGLVTNRTLFTGRSTTLSRKGPGGTADATGIMEPREGLVMRAVNLERLSCEIAKCTIVGEKVIL